MTSKIIGLATITILLSAVVVMGLSTVQDAEAKPISKSPNNKFSKWTKAVCGDKLCDDKGFMKTKIQVGKSKIR